MTDHIANGALHNGEDVYQRLRELIVFGKLVQERPSRSDVSPRSCASRTPVRDALKHDKLLNAIAAGESAEAQSAAQLHWYNEAARLTHTIDEHGERGSVENAPNEKEVAPAIADAT